MHKEMYQKLNRMIPDDRAIDGIKPYAVDTQALYMTDRLKTKLLKTKHYPMTIIEAPFGFGKTTALDLYFNSPAFLTVFVYRVTMLEPSLLGFWKNFCRVWEKVDPNSAELLKRFKTFNESSINDIEEILKNADIAEEIYLVFDGLGDIRSRELGLLINALSRHGIKNLHMIVAALQLPGITRIELLQNKNIHTISEADFVFSRNDIASYYQKAGVTLSEEQLEELQSMTGGWAFALYIQLLSYAESGKFIVGRLDDLIEHAFWNPLDEDEKRFYLSLSPLHSFTLANAAFVSETSSSYARRCLENNGFVHFDYQARLFFFHSIILSFLQRMFDALSDADQRSIFFRCGEWAEKSEDRARALVFYNKAQAYEKIYKSVDSSYEIADIADENTRSVMMNLLENAPEEIKTKYPFALVPISFALFFLGETELLAETIPHIFDMTGKSALPQRERNAVCGELELLLSFLQYNKIDEMSVHHRNALALLEGRASLISLKSTWTFGSPSVLYMFYRESGKLSDELKQMDACMPIYYQLTGGHGYGAEIMMRAESVFMQGNFSEAEALCHHALFAASGKGQNSIYLCGLFLLARMAQFKGDDTALNEIIHMIRESAKQNTEDLCRYTLDLSLGFLDANMGNVGLVADWLKQGRSFETMLTMMTVPFAYIIYGKLLLAQKAYQKLFGTCAHALELSDRFPNLLPQIYMRIYQSAAEYETGLINKAGETLSQALDMALPDKLYIPFAENFEAIQAPLAKLRAEAYGDRADLEAVFSLGKRFSVSTNALCENRISLSPRERDVVILVKKGYTNKEISTALYISVATVKKTLEHLFRKTGIVSRTQLKSLDI